MKALSASLLLLLFFILMLANPALCIRAASDGLSLWYSQVLPSLFPAMLLTSLIVRSGLLTSLLSSCRPLRGLPAVYLIPLTSGLLCGYPIGAKTCFDLYRAGSLTREDVRFLNRFVHCPSPMFMAGFVCTVCLPGVSPVLLMLSVYLPLFVLILLSGCAKKLNHNVSSCRSVRICFSMELFEDVYSKSTEIMVRIAGYLMLFSILNRLLLHYFPNASALLAVLGGMLEMTYGIRFASSMPLSLIVRRTLCVFFLGFGGLSGMLQVRDALPEGTFCVREYLSFRLLHAALAAAFFLILSAAAEFV